MYGHGIGWFACEKCVCRKVAYYLQELANHGRGCQNIIKFKTMINTAGREWKKGERIVTGARPFEGGGDGLRITGRSCYGLKEEQCFL